MSEPDQLATHPPAAVPPPARTRTSSRLPWTLVAILSVAVLGLTGMVSVQEREIAELKGQSPTTPSASAVPSTDATALMESLPRREEGDPRALGRVDAPVVLIDWSDFRCPFCAHWSTTTFKELQPYIDSGSLRVEFRDLVLFGEESELAAVASRAAAAQGRFWEFSDALFADAPASGHATITEDDVIEFARRAGVADLAKFKADLSDPALVEAVKAESAQAQSLGISGTPFFLVNTTPISGAQPLDTFIRTIESYGGRP